MAHFATNTGHSPVSRPDQHTETAAPTREQRPVHKFLHEWRVITRHPDLDRIRRQETDWSRSLDGRLS